MSKLDFGELKSVSVDVIAQLIKLVFYHNHINKLNVFNQVSLVALNVIADVNDEVTVGTPGPSNEMLHDAASTVHQSPGPCTDPILLGAINKPSHISLMDDLAFDVAQDPETAQVIRRLEGLKLSAVKGENFELARKMKDVINELQKIGEILCHYEVEKKLAIEREDYETAKEKKLQGEQLRSQIYDHLGVMNLLSGGASAPTDHPRAKHPPTMKGGVAISTEMPSVTFSMPRSTSQVPVPVSTGQVPMPRSTSQVPMPVSTSQVPKPFSTNQEPLLPTLKHTYASLEVPVDQGDTVLLSVGNDIPSKPEPMTDKELNECSFAVEAFGTEALEHICSKQYQLREKGLTMVLQGLPSLELPSRKDVSTNIKAVCQVLSRGLSDQVLPTFSLAVELLKYLLGPYSQKHRFSKLDFSFIIGKVTPLLLIRAGDMAPRMRAMATDTLLYLAHHDHIKSSCRLVVARLEVLERFLQEIGTEAGGLSLEAIMEVTNVCLVHVNKMVRDIAVRITLDLYKQYGVELRRMLPSRAEDSKNKTTVWKALFDGFDRIDGVPSDKDRKNVAQATQVAKQNEIKKLQSQLKVLRELTAKGPSLTHAAAVIEGHIPSHEVPEPSQEVADDASKLDMTCVFCGEKRVDFTGNNLEPHYLTECPMLAQCTHCSQVVEIPELKNHWLTECEEEGGGFKECPNCRVAIPTAHFSTHVQANTCTAVTNPLSNVCPLCHQVVPPGDTGWKEHLLGTSSPCAMNPRSKPKDMHPSDLMPRPHPPPPHPDPTVESTSSVAVPKVRQTRKK
eukprot:Em0008g1175a